MMTLTANTTEAELIEPVTQARARLAQWANEPASSQGQVERLTEMVHSVWATEALARVRHEIVTCLKHHEDSPEEVRRAAVQTLFLAILTRSADDQYSGRKNDGRRAALDAVRAEIADLRWTLTRPVTE